MKEVKAKCRQGKGRMAVLQTRRAANILRFRSSCVNNLLSLSLLEKQTHKQKWTVTRAPRSSHALISLFFLRHPPPAFPFSLFLSPSRMLTTFTIGPGLSTLRRFPDLLLDNHTSNQILITTLRTPYYIYLFCVTNARLVSTVCQALT